MNNERLHAFFRVLQLSPLQLFCLPWTTIDQIDLFSELCTYIAIRSFLVDSEYLKSRAKALVSLSLPLSLADRRTQYSFANWLLLFNLLCVFDFSNLLKKNLKDSLLRNQTTKITKCSFLKITYPQNTQGRNSFSSPINERKMQLPPFLFYLCHVCVAWRFVAVVSKKIKWQREKDHLLD